MRVFLPLLALVLAMPAASGAQQALVLTLAVERPAFSPDGDGVRDSLGVFLELAGDSAQVIVVVRADAGGVPGPIVDTLLAGTLEVGPDTLFWDGTDSLGSAAPVGRYWIVARAENSRGTSEPSPAAVVLDTQAPAVAVVSPARSPRRELVHRVSGFARDGDGSGLQRLEVSLASGGGALDSLLCDPCLADSVAFDLEVPDAIAAAETLTVTVSALDVAGNAATLSRSFVVDSLPPPPPVLDPLPPLVERPELRVSGDAPEADSVIVYLDGTEVSRVRAIAGRFALILRGFAVGGHTVTATSQDAAGNRSEPAAGRGFEYREALGASVPERFRAGDLIQVNLVLPARSIEIRIYTLRGRLVRTFERRDAGAQSEFAWDLTDDGGELVGSGPYVVRVRAEDEAGTAHEVRLATVVTR